MLLNLADFFTGADFPVLSASAAKDHPKSHFHHQLSTHTSSDRSNGVSDRLTDEREIIFKWYIFGCSSSDHGKTHGPALSQTAKGCSVERHLPRADHGYQRKGSRREASNPLV